MIMSELSGIWSSGLNSPGLSNMPTPITMQYRTGLGRLLGSPGVLGNLVGGGVDLVNGFINRCSP